jgi:hypothetical protein
MTFAGNRKKVADVCNGEYSVKHESTSAVVRVDLLNEGGHRWRIRSKKRKSSKNLSFYVAVVELKVIRSELELCSISCAAWAVSASL